MPALSLFSWAQYTTSMTLANVQSNTTPGPFVGETFTFNGGASQSIGIDDDDPDFEDGYVETGAPQTLNTAITIDGTTFSVGDVVELEVALIDASGQEIYVVRIDGVNVGLTYRVGEEPAVNDVFTVDSGLDGTGNASGEGSLEPYAGVICYAAGTQVLTPHGERPIENLLAGNLVETADNGAQQILWTGHRSICFAGQNPIDAVRPVSLTAGCLGNGLPKRDLIVSPQHRIVIKGQVVYDMFGVQEVMAPAIGLTTLPGVRVMVGKRDVTYVHLLLAGHEVLFANGAASESLYPGVNAMEMMPTPHRRAIVDLIPGLKENPVTGYGRTARLCLSRKDAKALVKALIQEEWAHLSRTAPTLRRSLPET